MSETSQPKDIFKHAKGSFERLNGENYPSWKINCRYLLLANDEWDIVTGDEVAPEIPLNGNPLQIGVATGLLKDFRKRRQDATYIIHNSCSESVHAHINQTDDPKVMWDALAKIFDTANETVGRQSLFRDFMAMRPTLGESINSWFVKLVGIRNRLVNTPEAINDMTFKTHIFNSLPDAFEMTSKILQNEPNLTVEDIISRLKRDEQTRAMRVKSEATTEAHYSATQPARGRGRGRGRGRQGAGRGNKWCTFCCTSTHDTEDCRSKQWGHRTKRKFDDSTENDASTNSQAGECFHCGETGHFIANCPVKKRGDEARDKKKKQKTVKVEAEDGY
jgi:hypothetical protein